MNMSNNQKSQCLCCKSPCFEVHKVSQVLKDPWTDIFIVETISHDFLQHFTFCLIGYDFTNNWHLSTRNGVGAISE